MSSSVRRWRGDSRLVLAEPTFAGVRGPIVLAGTHGSAIGACETPALGVAPGVATARRQCGAIPLAVSSLIAFSLFDKCASPIPRSTFAALVN